MLTNLKWACVVVALGALGTAAVPSAAQVCLDNSLYAPTASGTGDPCESESFVGTIMRDGKEWVAWQTTGPAAAIPSAGWHSIVYPYGPDPDTATFPLPWYYDGGTEHVPSGFRLGRNQLVAPPPGDFLPVGQNLLQHSTCLLPPGGESVTTDWLGTFRQTAGGKADLITGVPLAQVTDLELGFGAATFRMNRTRSYGRSDVLSPEEAQNGITAPDKWWDWTGMGWMMSENPILLIDSSLADVTGNQPRTTYFAVDAHHSIPFQLIEATGQYEAPPRFRARLTHNGEWGVDGSGDYTWLERPTQFDVYLYERALQYTFVAVWEDVPPNRWKNSQNQWEHSSYNDRPTLPSSQGGWNNPIDAGDEDNKGLGVPYYGLCTEIKDQHGHVIQIEYVTVKSSSMDDGSTGTGGDCVECQQRTNQKGQIRSIKLIDRDFDGQSYNDTVEWTLLYIHRMFKGFEQFDIFGNHVQTSRIPDGSSGTGDDGYGFEWVDDDYGPYDDLAEDGDEFFQLHGFVALDRVYVFAGDITEQYLEDAEEHLSISHTERSLPHAGTAVDPLGDIVAANASFPSEWTHEVRYFYDEDPVTNRPLSPPLLIHTQTTTANRDSSGSDRPVHRHRVYMYELDYGTSGSGYQWSDVYNPQPAWQELYHDPWLRYVFEHEGLLDLADSWGQLNPVPPGVFDYNAIGRRRATSTGARFDDAVVDQWSEYAAIDWEPHDASVDFPYSSNDSGRDVAPPLSTMHLTKQIVLAEERLKNANQSGTVKNLSYYDEGGVRRFYRLNALWHLPDEIDQGGSFGQQVGSFPSAGHDKPMRSVFFHPYYWHTYEPYDGHSHLVNEVALHESRWVALTDEYEDYETLVESSTSARYDGPYATRPGQTRRRVLEMNPTGYVLRDREWEFLKNGDVIASGGGLGEQFIYDTIENYAAQNLPVSLPAPGNDPAADPWNAIRNELVLVQQRSVGWSAGWADNDPGGQWDENSEGMVRFFEYDLDLSEAVFDFEAWPRRSRFRLVAEGIQQGSGESGPAPDKYYTRQVLFDYAGNRPTDVIADVEFTSWGSGSALLTAPPTPLGEPAASGVVVRQYRSHWDDDDPDGTPETERRLLGRSVIGPPREQRPDDNIWYYPVEIEFYDDDGNTEWSATGLVQDPLNPMAATPVDDSLIWTYYERENGAARYTVVDAVQGTSPSSSKSSTSTVTIPSIGTRLGVSNWARIPASGGENAVTEFEYDDDFGLIDIYMPNNRRWSKRVVIKQLGAIGELGKDGVVETRQYAREYIFNSLYRAGSDLDGDTGFYTDSAGEVNKYPTVKTDGSPSRRRHVTFDQGPTGGIDLPDLGEIEPMHTGVAYTELWRADMALDANGRPQEATLLEPDVNGAMIAVGTKMFNDLGEIIREQEIDGSVMRQTKNQLGFPLRTYVGTRDTGWLAAEDQQSYTEDEYNMVLVSRVEYGLGLHDAWLPTVTRSYRSNPSWAWDHHGAVNGEVDPATDDESYATVTSYDWRMRPVRSDTYDQGAYDPPNSTAERLSTTLTYLDHAGRPSLVVTYGAGSLNVTSGLDPVQLDSAESIPSPEDFLPDDLGLRPTSVVEMVYGYDGSVKERRAYDIGWDGTGSLGHQSEFSFVGRGGQVVYSQQPGQPIVLTELDGLGRTKESLTIAPDPTGMGVEHELTKSVHHYDGSGNVSEVEQWTRVSSSGDALSSTNAVRSRTLYWYDDQKRLVATADLGTESSSNQWVWAAAGYTSYDPDDPPVWNESTDEVDLPPNFPVDALVSVYVYDQQGNQVLVVDPMGLVTEYEYNTTNRMTRKIENARAANASDQRTTDYGYEWGRVTSLAMSRTVDNSGYTGETQTSRAIYADEDEPGVDIREGAEVVDESFNVVTRNNAVVKWLELLGSAPLTGSDPSDPDLTFRYTFDGQVAERIDARGLSFRYSYDALGRIEAVEVGHYPGASYDTTAWVAGYPSSGGQIPSDRVGYVEYTYESFVFNGSMYVNHGDRGQLGLVTAYDKDPVGGGIEITQNRYDFDLRDSIVTDWQAQGQTVDTSVTPATSYAWDYQPTDLSIGQTGRLRPSSITYPTHDASTPRSVTFAYGATAGDRDDLLNRLTQVGSNFGTVSDVATFAHVGVARRSQLTLGDGEIIQDLNLGGEQGLAGLDMFGRLSDLHFTNALTTEDTLFRAQYTYDANSNRLTSRLTQVAPAGGGSYDNIRSQANEYDGLNRLSGTEYGALIDTGGGVLGIDPAAQVRTDQWQLDLLGNWSGGPLAGDTNAGRISTGNLDGFGGQYAQPNADAADDEWHVSHDVNDLNELTYTELFDDDAAAIIESGDPEYDQAGNLTYDGRYYYQYDAWNRLVQVNATNPDGNGGYTVAALLKHFMYDGLGRLVRTQTPTSTGSIQLKVERYYYDGLRRIQEFTTTPSTSLGGSTGDPTLEGIASQTVPSDQNLDGESAPAGYDQGQQMLSGGGLVQGNVVREYIWGPGDNGFDELLVQYDQMGVEAWAIQDGGGDLVAFCDLNGDDGQNVGFAQVVGQWTYDAYGEVLTAEQLGSFSQPRLGHKGLFVARLDGPPSSPRVIPFAHNIYHMRNRAYAPGLGRFMQRDPNQTAIALVEATAMHGRGLGALSLAFDIEGLYGDGGNLYEYLGSNPWTRFDPLGLSYDPFDMVDEYLAETTGNRAAFLSQMGMGAKAMAVVTASIASYLPIPIVSHLGDAALYAMGEQSGTEFAVAMSLGIIPGGKLLQPFGKFLGNIGSSLWKSARHYASKGSSKLGGTILGITQRAKDWVVRKVQRVAGRRGCGCFAATTVVWTTAGAVPISELDGSQTVLSAPDDGAATAVQMATEFQPFTVGEASLVVLTIEHGDGTLEQIPTTDEHPFHDVESDAWVRADGLSVGDRLSTLTGEATVSAIAYGGQRVPVYNLSIPGSPTYYVGQQGLWVHNCLTEIDFEKFVRNSLGSQHAFKVGGREFDGRIGQLWYEVKTSPTSRWADWEKHKDQLGSQVAIARQRGRAFALFTPDEIPEAFQSWLSSKGIVHRLLKP